MGDTDDEATRCTELVRRWREGDHEAADELYGRYIRRMTRIIGRNLSPGQGRRLEPEDIAHSAFRTVFRRLRDGEFHFRDDSDLWKLLVTVSLNKARGSSRRNLAQKRTIEREESLSRQTEHAIPLLQKEPSIGDVVAFRETLQLVLSELGSEDAEVLRLRLEGHNQAEMASQLGVTPRTVRRKMSDIRRLLKDLLLTEESDGD